MAAAGGRQAPCSPPARQPLYFFAGARRWPPSRRRLRYLRKREQMRTGSGAGAARRHKPPQGARWGARRGLKISFRPRTQNIFFAPMSKFVSVALDSSALARRRAPSSPMSLTARRCQKRKKKKGKSEEKRQRRIRARLSKQGSKGQRNAARRVDCNAVRQGRQGGRKGGGRGRT